MNNILILGSGRSGTSMLTGMLANSGFHLGNNYEYLKNDLANPKGYFEDYEINTINEDILKQSLLNLPETIRKVFFPAYTFYRARWLAKLSLSHKIKSTASITNRIKHVINTTPPFCYKDPRFSYTLPIWQQAFKEENIKVKYLVVYREPYKTAKSIVRECKEDKALNALKMTEKLALKVWQQMYSHILRNYEKDTQKENWRFIHFDQLFELDKLSELAYFLEAKLDNEFPDKQLSRSNNTEGILTIKSLETYNKLKELSLKQ